MTLFKRDIILVRQTTALLFFTIFIALNSLPAYCQWDEVTDWEKQLQTESNNPEEAGFIIFFLEGLDEESRYFNVNVYAHFRGRASAVYVFTKNLNGDPRVEIPIRTDSTGVRFITTSVGAKLLDELRAFRIHVKKDKSTGAISGGTYDGYEMQKVQFDMNQLKYNVELGKRSKFRKFFNMK
ncbi:MAG: hypothetical protein GF315_08160 [candidate division Zixibacteria bacterium]|nr:hypothetical protein [candidate division Zixibacteria bacterium]